MIAAELHIPPSESMTWEWGEILDRYADAIQMRRDAAMFQARIAGAKMRGK